MKKASNKMILVLQCRIIFLHPLQAHDVTEKGAHLMSQPIVLDGKHWQN